MTENNTRALTKIYKPLDFRSVSEMQQRNLITDFDAQIMSKIIAFVPLRFVVELRFVCRQFNSSMRNYIEYICSGMIQNSPKQQPLIDSTKDQTCLYRLFDLYSHRLLSHLEYAKYKTQLGFSDDYLRRFYGDSFLAFKNSSPREPYYKSEYRKEWALIQVRAYSISLVNFSTLIAERPSIPWHCQTIFEGLVTMSEELQCKIVERFPDTTFCLNHVLAYKLSLPVMLKLGDKIGATIHWTVSAKFTRDYHFYLRELIPFFQIYGGKLPPLFLIMGMYIFHKDNPTEFDNPTDFKEFGELEPDEFESVVLAIALLGKYRQFTKFNSRESYKPYFSSRYVAMIEARLDELNGQSSRSLHHRDMSPKRKTRK